MTETRSEYGELKLCPFCSKPFTIQTFSENMIFVRHNVTGGCPLTGGIAISGCAEDVVKWLSTRPIEDALNAQIDDMTRRNIDLESDVERLQKALNEKDLDRG